MVSSSILLFQYTDSQIGYFSRIGTAGPEAEIVYNFLRVIMAKYECAKGEYAIFLEPKLDTGFPDIVVVKYRRDYFLSHWNENRKNLITSDLRLLNFLYSTNGVTSRDIISMLGVSESSLRKSLGRLESADMITCNTRHTWRPKALMANWGIQSILSIEAKIKDWNSAISQAETNVWFANESYVLFPSRKISAKITADISEKALGVFFINEKQQIRKLLNSSKNVGPRSYASWLFNEWIGNKLNNYLGENS